MSNLRRVRQTRWQTADGRFWDDRLDASRHAKWLRLSAFLSAAWHRLQDPGEVAYALIDSPEFMIVLVPQGEDKR